MKVSAVIAEYNIFHNGHKYMLDEIRKRSDAVIAVMSGSFVQRGDAAVTDKWSRARAALLNGADLVIELPVIYALSTAQKFAFGGVSLINELGIADELCFGSETGHIDELVSAANILENEPCGISEKIKRYSAEGMNYPSARAKAYSGIIKPEILDSPNNILALEYIRSIMQLKSSVIPSAVKRFAAGHHDLTVYGNIASASAVRDMIRRGQDCSAYIPENTSPVTAPYDLSRLDSAVICKLRTSSPEYLSQINDVSEGLENRIIKLSGLCSSIEELAESIKTKRYTRTRINRILISSLLDLTSDLCALKPSYIRVLGMNKTGMTLLGKAKRVCRLPIVTKTADFDRHDPIFKADLRATDIFAMCAPYPEKRTGGLDFTTPPVII